MIAYPRIIAHRCGGALAPENSLAGLAVAARLGCRAVEFDVMLTADGVPILIHDETLERTTTGAGRVADRTLAEIRRFDAGGPHHVAFAAPHAEHFITPVPTFAEAMAACRRLGLWPNIEIKPAAGHDEITGETVARWLGENWNGTGVISSFSEKSALAARRVLPQFPQALLVEHLPGDWQAQLERLGAVALHLAAKHLTPQQAAALNDAGVPWAAYTVNDPASGARLYGLGAAAVFTDRPDLWLPAEM
ncbi:MAG: glycerophosphodiester phosphodiesterase [Gammaproteobacteria bacterium]|nr:glycerophosphodiester phosphodiesterase [Rhodocyclaceae bacterium]MBU3908329.1 glycerophosphodiester phosphodiesterase [Gammaproteobacteria bacterium]MBU3987838.1 glycerophosphodiester phosphodiesterase [Gammaproteobacteria bacterium]MBU4004039.1 glycerophosphodiester phosphodiesterase [Gammaproteobacteria bacterium]MBU4020286.1 glycerophosphodiester phosphodiesterase [Gammaproteobacteria bacterium]